MQKILISCLLLSACGASSKDSPSPADKEALSPFSYPTRAAGPDAQVDSPRMILYGATVMTAAGEIFKPGYLITEQGKIVDVQEGTPGDEIQGQRVELSGKFITPGIIDTHSHMGVYPVPFVDAHADGNEMVAPTTPGVWAEYAFWPQDPSIPRALAGGVTSIQVLPGSANLIGGRSFTAKLKPSVDARAMRFPGAPQGVKMACGENPKRVYGKRGGPQTRMGSAMKYREAFYGAQSYWESHKKYQRDFKAWETQNKGNKKPKEDPPTPPSIDQNNETLMRILDGRILVHMHCYRADELHLALDLAEEFGFKIRSFHHGLGAYKLADRLAKVGTAVSTWSDWWGFKMEAYDGIPYNAALLSNAGARAIIHSDSEVDIRFLNLEAAKAQSFGKELGLSIDDNETLRWVTANPAWALGIDAHVGTLEGGKMADLVVWSGHPFSTYTLAERVMIDGHFIYQRTEGRRRTDFEVGQPYHAIQSPHAAGVAP